MSEKWVKEQENEGFLFHSSRGRATPGDVETERSSKGIWYPKEYDRDIRGCFRASIACQALSPEETPIKNIIKRTILA